MNYYKIIIKEILLSFFFEITLINKLNLIYYNLFKKS